MEIKENTKIIDIINEYPWVVDELVKIDERLSILSTTMGKMLARKYTLQDVCKMGNVSMDYVLEEFDKLLKQHENPEQITSKEDDE